MDKEDFIYLTNNLYNLTLLFPKKEPLRYKMRELADEILANSVLAINGDSRKSRNLFLDLEKNLEILNSFFEIAKGQNWVSPVNVLAMQEEYDKLREEFQRLYLSKKDENSKEYPPLDSFRVQPLLERQQKILEILKEKGKIQVWELKNIFPEVTKRTIRRDFEKMLSHGLIERVGERNGTFYQIKSYQG